MVVLDGNFVLGCGPGTNIPMYARTDRCYNEGGSRTNHVRSSIPHCTYKRNIDEDSCNHCCCRKAM